LAMIKVNIKNEGAIDRAFLHLVCQPGPS
jgi:hypothetical protein